MAIWLVLSRDAYRGGDPGISPLKCCCYITDDTCVINVRVYYTSRSVLYYNIELSPTSIGM